MRPNTLGLTEAKDLIDDAARRVMEDAEFVQYWAAHSEKFAEAVSKCGQLMLKEEGFNVAPTILDLGYIYSIKIARQLSLSAEQAEELVRLNCMGHINISKWR